MSRSRPSRRLFRQVTYLGAKANSVREGCGKWGVVAVEEIPARSFVCTVAGQV